MKAHDSLCPKTWARDECWCDLYKKVWVSMFQHTRSHDWRGRVLMLPVKYVDGGMSC